MAIAERDRQEGGGSVGNCARSDRDPALFRDPYRSELRGRVCGRSENAATEQSKCRGNARRPVHESEFIETDSRVSTTASEVDPLGPAEGPIALEGFALVLEA
jgi:hypothetical protein